MQPEKQDDNKKDDHKKHERNSEKHEPRLIDKVITIIANCFDQNPQSPEEHAVQLLMVKVISLAIGMHPIGNNAILDAPYGRVEPCDGGS